MKLRTLATAIVGFAAFVAAAGTVTPALAGDVVWIESGDAFLNPVADTDTGDVEWRWGCSAGTDLCAGTHNVTAYAGASFASGDLSGPGSSFAVSLAMAQLPVKYRCTIHSTIEPDGHCDGMCGMIVRRDPTPPEVSIVSPPNGEILVGPGLEVPVTITGTASDAVGIWKVELRVYDTLGVARDVRATCEDCFERAGEGPHIERALNWDFTPNVTWMATVELLPGSYRVEATAFDVPRTNWTRSPRTGFIVI